jgi:DNA invertase Pin-like site-specific DNA recombinase
VDGKDRPQFDALLRAVARKEFDVVAAWSVDRLGRSLQDLIGFLSDLQSKKVDLYLHQQALDTCLPSSAGVRWRDAATRAGVVQASREETAGCPGGFRGG